MKKGLFLSISLLLFFFSLFYGDADTTFYRSDIVGIAIEEIPWYRADEFRYVLKVVNLSEGKKRVENKTLLEGGNEVKRWEIFYSKWGNIEKKLYYENKKLRSEASFDSLGRIVVKREFGKNKVIMVTRYKYIGNLLKERFVRDGRGKELWEENFFYDRFGRLIRVVREFSDGRRLVSIYNMGNFGIYDELQSFNSRAIVLRYDSHGREVESEEWKGNILLKRKYTHYYPNSSKPKLIEVFYSKEKKRVVEKYNSGGYLIDRKEIIANVFEREEIYEWKESLLVEKKILDKKEGVGLYRYFYDSSKRLIREEYWVKGELESSKEYTDNKSMVESFYRGGKVFLKRYYRDNKKVREEIIENAKVIRERKFE